MFEYQEDDWILRGWLNIKRMIEYQDDVWISRWWWLNIKKMIEYQEDDWISRRWINIKEIIKYQDNDWISRRWINIKMMIEYQGDDWISRGWSNIKMMFEYQEDDWISRWCLNNKMMIEYQDDVWISRRWLNIKMMFEHSLKRIFKYWDDWMDQDRRSGWLRIDETIGVVTARFSARIEKVEVRQLLSWHSWLGCLGVGSPDEGHMEKWRIRWRYGVQTPGTLGSFFFIICGCQSGLVTAQDFLSLCPYGTVQRY